MTEVPQLHEADGAEVTILVDNYLDMFTAPTTDIDRRPPFSLDRPLLAEHGLSCLVRVSAGGRTHDILMDTGISPGCMLHNARQLNFPLDRVEALVLSHGHFDHTGGIGPFLAQAGRQVPLILHPDAFLSRRLNNPKHGSANLPTPDRAELEKAGADILLRAGPSALASGYLLVTGEVERTTPFEKGFPGMEYRDGNAWVPDPIRDDQALVINVKGKGLVVISGCAHAGIINTVRYARKITGVGKIHAVMGGFHLTGPLFAPVIQPTIDEMKRIDPAYVIPMHCSGWDAINRFMQAMPGRVILNTVGTKYVF